MKKSKDVETKKRRSLRIILMILFLASALYIISFNKNYPPEYLTKIVCKEQTYEGIGEYIESVPYNVCVGYSFWTGECNQWKIKYRSVTKSIPTIEYTSVCIRVYSWKSADYNFNWLDYPNIYQQNGRAERDIKVCRVGGNMDFGCGK